MFYGYSAEAKLIYKSDQDSVALKIKELRKKRDEDSVTSSKVRKEIAILPANIRAPD